MVRDLGNSSNIAVLRIDADRCVIDFLLTLLLPSLILVHLLVAPYAKVEESFNLQAAHDILTYSTPTHAVGARLRASYDHFAFPGAVPRTFVGAAALAGVSRPVLQIVGRRHAQLVVRAVLGLFNAFALLRYKEGVRRAFGGTAARWFVLLLASQFHVVYYASRTLPNMFAFGLSTLALRELLPMPLPAARGRTDSVTKRHSLAIYLFVLAGIVFRSELAILLAAQVLYLLVKPLTSLQTIIPVGVKSAGVALAISIPIDSYFWQRPVWPELAGFFYNAIQGKSADWGTSPFHAYFTSFLPKLLLNPLIFLLLIPSALYFPATRRSAIGLVVPSLAFIAIYSLQPHKEARFIIYVVPPLTACAALGADYIFTRRSRSVIHRLLSYLIILSIIGSLAASTAMLGVSSLNYPGGEALFRLHELVTRSGAHSSDELMNRSVSVHMDVLACMTGVSRFQQDSPTPPFSHYLTTLAPLAALLLPSSPASNAARHDPEEAHSVQIKYSYDKTEDPATLLDPAFWTRFDYVLAERPETVIGKWEVADTVYGYAGIEVLRPGVLSRSGVEEGEDVARRAWKDIGGSEGGGGGGGGDEVEGKASIATSVSVLEMFHKDVERLGAYGAVREGTRRWITRGWWVGPRMEAKLRILKRVP